MTRREIKVYSNYREGIFEQENEPEEGEIVDDYELIVSSDEELSMRQRIRELEAENAEIEQIAVISRSYVDELKPLRNNLDNNRAARVPTDASSISSTEFITPKKHKRRKSKERKRKHCHHQHHHHHQHHNTQQRHDQQLPQYDTFKAHSHIRKTQCKRRQKIIAKKYGKLHSDRYMKKDIPKEIVSLDSPDSSASSSSLTDTETCSKNSIHYNRKNDSYITRDTLRLAVARNSTDSIFSPKKSCLKDKLLRQELVNHAKNDLRDDGMDDDVEVIEPEVDIQTVEEDSSGDSMEEKELRLIALKSAVLKKHMARKRRNAEAAYSPTDFDDMLSSGILHGPGNKLADIDLVDLEEDDFQNGCIIVSPEASPQLMMLDDQDDSQQMMDCKPVDMDIVNSDSEDATMGAWSKELTPTIPSFSYASQEFAKQFHYGMYMHEIELPPPPPGVDDYEEEPPPAPCFKAYNAKMQDMELDNEELIKDIVTIENKKNIAQECVKLEASKDMTLSSDVKHEEEKEVDEEEEEALRALLLSKFQSPKNLKKLHHKQISTECKENSNENENRDQSNAIQKKPTEFILKEAVKRLKIHSQSDVLKEEQPFDQQKEDNILLNDYSKENCIKSHECWEEHNDSLISLGALRKRLIKLKHQSQLIERDEFIKEAEDKQQILAKKNHEMLEVQAETENTISSGDLYTKPKTTSEHLPLIQQNISKSDSAIATNNVDVSDITRRLQKIKDEILNASATQKPHETSDLKLDMNERHNENPPAMAKNTLTEPNILGENNKETVINKSIFENIPHTHKSFHNNVDNIGQTENDHKVLTKHKIVKADFDATKNLTTFKVTISNSAALQAEENEIETSIEESSLKDNNAMVNNNNTIIASNDSLNTIENSKEVSRKTIFLNKSAEIENDNTTLKLGTSAPLTHHHLVVKAPAGATALPTYSVSRPTKIVKPNKVINTNLDLKRRHVPQNTDTILPTKNSKTEQFLPKVSKLSENSRLISSMDQVMHMCKIPQFIISVHNSSNESSADEWGDYDTLYKPLYDYNDNASPLSLNLESPCRTPIRSNSPIETTNNNNKDTGFEEKLDKFLKTVRTTVRTENIIEKTPQNDSTKQCGKTTKTPLAVRHLPAAAQSEYRRLVHRMKLLETQRKSTQIIENNTKSKIGAKEQKPESSEDNNKAENENDTTTAVNAAASKTSLVKQVLIRNANNNSTSSDTQKNVSTDSGAPKFHKTNVLRSYENIYVKIGAGIVNHLDKSLKLVDEAKKAKISKLKVEKRLKELKAEMDILQTKHKEEQQKISRIYPSICTTNDVITSLKQKRSKVFKAALNLGKTIKGEEYRLNNDLKESITTKTKKLAAEIKLVNSLKAQDIANIEDVYKLIKNKELIEDEKKGLEDTNTNTTVEEEDAIQSQHHQRHKRKTEKDSTIDNNTVCAQDSKDINDDDDDDTTLPATLNGGNTEFQNMDHDTPKNIKDEKERNELAEKEAVSDANEDCEKKPLSSYISPLGHLRNKDSNMDPNGVICPYELMGNCEDATCKYVHISPTV